MSETSWFADEWFWKNYSPIMFDDQRMAASAYEAAKISDICGLKSEASVLDCCCGMGRHSVELADAGYKVTAVDLSHGYIERARKTAAERSVIVDFIEQDIRDIQFVECFDSIINMFSSFGYFEDPAEDLELLKKLFKALKSGGSLFMEMQGKEIIARDFEERTWFEREGVKILLEYSVDLNWTELHNRWLFYKNDSMTEYSFSHRIFSAAEIAELLWKAGFTTIEIYGNFEQAPYDHKASQLIVLGRKD